MTDNQVARSLPPLEKSPEEMMREAYEAQELIKAANQQINKLQNRIDSIKESLVTHGVYTAGNYELLIKSTSRRKINVGRFIEKYPLEYNRLLDDEVSRLKSQGLTVINIKDAERLIGKDFVDLVSDYQMTPHLVFVQREIE